MDKIADYTLSTGTAAQDTIDSVSGAVAANASNVDVSGADKDGNAADIKAKVVDGILTLSGADVAVIDTIGEWIDVAEIVLDATAATAGALAFEFDNNTYLIEDAADNNTDNIIELTGLTGVAAVDTAAALDAIVIA